MAYAPQIDEVDSNQTSGLKQFNALMRQKTLGRVPAEKFATQKDEKKHKNSQTKAVIMMNIFCLANTIQCVLYKIMSERGVSLLEYTLFRNLTIMGICCVLLYLQDRNPLTEGQAMTEEVKKKLLFRAFLGFTVTLLTNACLSLIPFSLLVIIFQTSPFWTSLLSYKFNNEPLYAVEVVGMILCFVGVCFITMSEGDDQNALLTGQTGHVDDEILAKEEAKKDYFSKAAGITLMFVASLMSSGIAVLNRTLANVPYSVVLFYHSFFGIFISLVLIVSLMVTVDRPLYFLEFTNFENGILFVATFMDAIGVMAQTIAFQSGNSSFVSLISFVNIIYAMISDVLFFNEPISLTQVIAACSILVVCVIVGLEKIRLNNLKQKLIKVVDVPIPIRNEN